MQKLSKIILSIILAASMATPVLAETTTAAKTSAAQQAHAAIVKQSNTTYQAAIKKAEADYKAAVDAAKAVLKKARADALAAMKAEKKKADDDKKVADEAVKIERANKKATLKVSENIALGKFLVANNGMTVYTKKDDTTDGKSTCYGACALNWPPVTVKGKAVVVAGENVTGKVATIRRTDGKFQVTYRGIPLYFWTGDKKAGDTTGNGFKGIWSVVAP